VQDLQVQSLRVAVLQHWLSEQGLKTLPIAWHWLSL
jgi:hypothetical protein